MLDGVDTSALVLAQAAASVSRSELRWEFANIAAAVALLSVTLAAIALFSFRRKTGDLTLIYFSLFCILYAVRLLAYLPSFRSLFGEPPIFWSYVGWVISNLVIFPGGLFLYQIVGQHLRKFLRWLLAARALFAVFEISAAVLGVSLTRLDVANDVKVIATLVATALFLVVSRLRAGVRTPLTHEFRVWATGFLLWLLLFLHGNLLGLKILRGHNVEVLGALVFVACLGYVAAHPTFANEERLLAIGKELEIARRIQFSTLPGSVPTLTGLKITARYVLMSAVAGDF
jgi:phosphoserine phosphatase RsbU/P